MKQFCVALLLAMALAAGARASSFFPGTMISAPCDTSATDPAFGFDTNRACLELTLNPSSGIATGAIGSTTGWGYTIHNPSPFWILFQGSTLYPVNAFSPGDPLDFCNNLQPSLNFGTCYNDWIALGSNTPFTFGALAPGATFSQLFDLNNQTGFASFIIVPVVTDSLGGDPMTVQPGLQAPSTIVEDYAAFTMDPNDPNFDPNASSVCTESTCGVWAGASINVTAATATPEPGTTILVGSALALLAALRLRRRFSAKP